LERGKEKASRAGAEGTRPAGAAAAEATIRTTRAAELAEGADPTTTRTTGPEAAEGADPTTTRTTGPEAAAEAARAAEVPTIRTTRTADPE
jgi:hypothetical protein